jgi:hypothetical protein
VDISQNKLTKLMVKLGDPQVSLQHAMQLNQQGVTPFKDRLDKPGAIAGYQVLLNGYANYILGKEFNTKEYFNLESLLKSLRAMPRPINAFVLKGSVSTYQLSNIDYRINYRIANGQVTVFNIQPVNKLQLQRDRLERVALYRVKKSSRGVWAVEGKVAKVTTPHAAVNGMLNNLAKASWLMGSHLEWAYGKGVREYTLFHNPSNGAGGDLWESLRDKCGFTTQVTKQFATVLAETQAAGNKTQWVAHSQGGIIFAEGVRYVLKNGVNTLANTNSTQSALPQNDTLKKLSANNKDHNKESNTPNPSKIEPPKKPTEDAKNKVEKNEPLNTHSVVFHGNANNNWRSNFIFKRAGIKVLDGHIHDYDIVGNVAGCNTANVRKIIGSFVYMNHVLKGSVTQSTHTLSQTHKNWEQAMTKGQGLGRGPVQTAFEKSVKVINNYLA